MIWKGCGYQVTLPYLSLILPPPNPTHLTEEKFIIMIKYCAFQSKEIPIEIPIVVLTEIILAKFSSVFYLTWIVQHSLMLRV